MEWNSLSQNAFSIIVFQLKFYGLIVVPVLHRLGYILFPPANKGIHCRRCYLFNAPADIVGHYIYVSMLSRIFFARLYIDLAGQHNFIDLKLA
jgi:hypothetical protein